MTRFLTEMHEQPAALRAMLEYYSGEGAEKLRAFRDLHEKGERALFFTGMGSSHHAPLAIQGQLASAGLRAVVWEAGELLHYHLETCTEDTVMVAVSQSGESAETQRVVEKIGGRCPVMVLTNEPDSALGRCGDLVLPLCAGEEAAISTKTYTNTLALLHLLATALTGGDLEQERTRLDRVAAAMEAFLAEGAEGMVGAAEFLEGANFLYFVARGPSLAAAYQGALIFNEGARMPTCALSGGTFRHGPLEMVDREFAGVFFAPKGKTRELTMSMAHEVAEAGGRVLLLADTSPEESGKRNRAVVVPEFGEALFPLNACMPVELLLHEMARQRGREAGVFERISKVTRRE